MKVNTGKTARAICTRWLPAKKGAQREAFFQSEGRVMLAQRAMESMEEAQAVSIGDWFSPTFPITSHHLRNEKMSIKIAEAKGITVKLSKVKEKLK